MLMHNRHKGVALITALIITTIGVSLAAMVMYRQQIQIRLSSNISNVEQAYLYANGMEDWAGTFLEKSYKKHRGYDSLDDDWSNDGKMITLPIDGGVMNGQLTDLQSLININSLARPKNERQDNGNNSTQKQGNQTPTPNQTGQQEPTIPPNQKTPLFKITTERLKNLIRTIDPDQEMGSPQEFIDVLSDWMDKDEDTRDFGAESPYYQSLEPAYLSANTLLVSPTELRLLKNMKTKIYKELVQYITTLPIKRGNKTIDTPINVNTASRKVLEAIGFDPATAERIEKMRKDNPFKNIKDFINNSDVAYAINQSKNSGSPIETDDLDVKSQFFLLRGSVNINNIRLPINSVLERKNGRVSVIMRDFSNP